MSSRKDDAPSWIGVDGSISVLWFTLFLILFLAFFESGVGLPGITTASMVPVGITSSCVMQLESLPVIQLPMVSMTDAGGVVGWEISTDSDELLRLAIISRNRSFTGVSVLGKGLRKRTSPLLSPLAITVVVNILQV